MSARGIYRWHSAQFKLQVCSDIRSGKTGRRTDQISANLIQLWLSQYDRGELNAEESAATTISEYEVKMAESRAAYDGVGQLTMEIDLLKKTPRLRPENSSETSSIISGPLPAGSNGGAR